MKLRKFITGLAVSALMVLTLGTTVFAAGSPSTSTATKTTPAASEAAALASGVSGDVIKLDGVDVSLPLTVKALDDATIASAKKAASGTVLKAVDAVPTADAVYEETITCRFRVPVKAGQKVTVLHLAEGSTTWETITPDEVGDGIVIATFTSLSPVAFVVEGVSDKTGSSLPAAGIAAAICLAGAVILLAGRRKFAK